MDFDRDERLRRYIYGSTKTSRDEYGNTAKDVAREKARLNKQYGQGAILEPSNLGTGTLGIPDAYSAVPEAARGPNVEISNSYASRHRYERLKKQNILDQNRKGEISNTQYRNENPGVDRNNPTGWIEKAADSIDDGYDDVMDYIFGKTKYKNKKEAEEAARADMNKQVNEDGNVIYSRQATMNDKSLDSLRSELMNAPDDPNADQIIYYGRVDNPDGTYSYKIGLAGVDTFGRTAEEARGKDITYLWAKRTKDAAKYEALFHGNRTLVRDRRNDLGMDPEGYGAGHTEIYNSDFLGLDGTVSMDKIETLNISTQSKLQSIGINVTGRYDDRGMRDGYKALEKAQRIYGVDSKEAKELSFLMSNMEQKGKFKQGLVPHIFDTVSAFASGAQQTLAGGADVVLDAVTPGNNTIFDNLKDPKVADEFWGYRGRDEANAKGRQALERFHKGDYVSSLLLAVSAGPDLVAQSLPDMAEMFLDVAAVLGTGGSAIGLVAARRAAKIALKAAIKEGSVEATRIGAKTFLKAFKKSGAWKQAANEAIDARKDMSVMKKIMSGDTYKALVPFTLEKGNKSRVALGATAGTAAWAARYTNNQIDERMKNNEGEEVGYPEIATMWTTNFFSGLLEKAALKETVSSKAMKLLGSASEAVKKNVVLKGLYKGVGLVEGGAVEAGQEYIQEYIEALNEGLGTKAFNYTKDIFHEEFQHRAELGAILGFGAGVTQHGGIGGVKNLIGLGKERKRKTTVNNSKDWFGNLKNREDVELNTEDSTPNVEGANYFVDVGREGQTTKENYEFFKKNISSSETVKDALNKVIGNVHGLMLGLGNMGEVATAISSILNTAKENGDIDEATYEQYGLDIKEQTEKFAAKLDEVFTSDKPKQTTIEEVVNTLDATHASNITTLAHGIYENMVATGLNLAQGEAIVTRLLNNTTDHSKSREIIDKVASLIDESKNSQESSTEEVTAEDDEDLDPFASSYSDAESEKAFNEIDNKHDKTNGKLDNTLAKAADVLSNTKEPLRKVKTVQGAVTQFNRLARSIAEREGKSTSERVSQIAEDLMVAYVYGDMEKVSDMDTFKTLTKVMFNEDNIDAAKPLGIFNALRNLPKKTVKDIAKMQELIRSGFLKAVDTQGKEQTEGTTQSIINTAKGIFLNTKGDKPSLQKHLMGLIKEINNPYTTADDMKASIRRVRKSLAIFSKTKNTMNTNDSNTEEIDKQGKEEQSEIEEFSTLLEEAYESAIQEKLNPTIESSKESKAAESTASTQETGLDIAVLKNKYVEVEKEIVELGKKLKDKTITTEEKIKLSKLIDKGNKLKEAIKKQEKVETKKKPKPNKVLKPSKAQVNEIYDPILQNHDTKRTSKELKESLEEIQGKEFESIDEKVVKKLVKKLSKLFYPEKLLKEYEIDNTVATEIMKLVKETKKSLYFNTKGAALVHYYIAKLKHKVEVIYRSAYEVVAVGINKNSAEHIQIDYDMIANILKLDRYKSIKNKSDFLNLLGTVFEELGKMVVPEDTVVGREDNPLMYFMIDENGKIPKEFHSAITKGFLEALANYDNNLRTVPKKEEIVGDVTKELNRIENLGYIVNEDDILVQGGLGTDNFVSYMAKTIARELELEVSNLHLKTKMVGLNGEEIDLTDNTKKEALDGITKSLATYVVTGLVKKKVMLTRTTIDKKSYIHYITYDNQHIVNNGIKSQANGLLNVYSVLAEKKYLRDIENPGLIFHKNQLPDLQEEIDKTGDSLSKSSKEHIEKVRNTKWFATDQLVKFASYSIKDIFRLLGYELDTIKPSYILNHTDMTTKELYTEVIGSKPTSTMTEQEMSNRLEKTYKDKMKILSKTAYSLPTYEGQTLESVMVVKAIKAYGEAGGRTLYFDATIGGNSRIYIQGLGLLSPQSSKFLRYLVMSELATNVIIDTSENSSNTTLKEFKSQIAEALSDFVKDPTKEENDKIDNSKIEEAEYQFDLLKVPQSLLDMVVALYDGNINNRDILNNKKPKDNTKILGRYLDLTDGSTLPALYAYAKYKEAVNSKLRYFTHSFSMGQDGKSSVVAHLAIMEAKLEDSWQAMLSTGTFTSYARNALYLQYKDSDPVLADKLRNPDNPKYIEDADDLANAGVDINDGYKQAMKNFSEYADGIVNAMNVLLPKDLVEINENAVTGEVEIGKVTNTGRTWVKPSQMTIVYGIQRKSSSENSALQFIEDLHDRIFAYRNGKTKDASIFKDLDKGLNQLVRELYKVYTPAGKQVAVTELTPADIDDFIKLVRNTDIASNEAIDKFLYTTLLKVSEQAIGDTLFNALTETNAPFIKDSKLLNATGVASVILTRIIEDTIDNKNASNKEVSSLFRSYQTERAKLARENLYKFGINQDITAVKKEASEQAAGTQNLSVPDLNGQKETSSVSFKQVEFKLTTNPGSPAVGSIHDLDKETAAVLSDLGLMQVYDSIYTFPGARAYAGGLANLAFLMNTVVHGNRYQGALTHAKTLMATINQMEEDEVTNDSALANVVGSIFTKDFTTDLYILQKTLGLSSSINNFSGFKLLVSELIKKLEVANKEQIDNMQKKKNVISVIAQYASEGRVEIDKDGYVKSILMNDGTSMYLKTPINLNADSKTILKGFKNGFNQLIKESNVFQDEYTNDTTISKEDIKNISREVSEVYGEDVGIEVNNYLSTKRFSTIISAKKATIHYLTTNSIDNSNPKIVEDLITKFFPGEGKENFKEPANLYDNIKEDIFNQIQNAIDLEERIVEERKREYEAYKPKAKVLTVGDSDTYELLLTDSYGGLKQSVFGKAKEAAMSTLKFIKNMDNYVTLDSEFTYNMIADPKTPLEISIRSRDGKVQTIYYRPKFFPTFLDSIDNPDNRKYHKIFSSTQYQNKLEHKDNAKNEKDFADKLYVMLKNMTNNGKIPLVAFNGFKSDLPVMAAMALRVGNVELHELINSLIVVDPMVAAYFIKDTAIGKGQHTQEAIYNYLTEKTVDENVHEAEYDAEVLNEIVQAIKTSKKIDELIDGKVETSTRPKIVTEDGSRKLTPEEGGVENAELADLLNNSSPESAEAFESDGKILPPLNPVDKAVQSFTAILNNENAEEQLDRLLTYDQVSSEEKTFLKEMFTEVLSPFYSGDLEIIYSEYKGKSDSTRSHGEANAYNSSFRGGIRLITRAGAFGATKQSSAEVFIHEHIHIIVEAMFGSKELQSQFPELFSFLKDMYYDAKSKADKSWLKDGSQETFNYIFNGTEKGMREFYSYALADHIFAKNIEENVKNPINKPLPKIDTSGIISTILSAIKKMLHWLVQKLDSRRHLSSTQLLKQMALEMNDVDTQYKNAMASIMNGLAEKSYALDSTLKYHMRGVSELFNNQTSALHNTLGGVDPTTPLGGLLQDLMPSTTYLNEYFKLMTEANTNVQKERTSMINKTSSLIEGVNEFGKPAISVADDTMLHDIALRFDLKAVYNWFYSSEKRYKIPHIVDALLHLDDTVAKISKNINSTDLALLQDAGKALFKRVVGESSINDSDVSIADIDYLMRRLHIENNVENKRAVDALVTLYGLKEMEQSKEHSDSLKEFMQNLSKGKFVKSLGNVLDMDSDIQDMVNNIKKNAKIDSDYSIKGNTHKVTDGNTRLAPRVMTNRNIELAEKLGHELIHTVDLPGTKVQIGIYKIQGSTTQRRGSGLVDITDIEYADVSTVRQLLVSGGVNDASVDKIMKKIAINQKTQFFSVIQGRKNIVTDFSFTIPSFLEEQHLDIDTRASTSLSHKRGAIETFNQAKKTNLAWVKLGARDVADNIIRNKKEFIWIGEGAKTSELVNYYRTLPRYLKNEIQKHELLSSKSIEGMWVRKEALTISLGAEGTSMMELLATFGVNDRNINYVIKRVENFMPIVGALYKNEIVKKVLDVVAGNLSSNILLELLKGRHNYVEVTRLMLKNMLELKDINTKQRKIAELRVKIRTIKNTNVSRNLNSQMEDLEKEVKRSYLYYFVKEGFNDNFVADVNANESKYMSDFDKKIYEMSQNHPALRKIFDIVYINRGTAMNTVMGDVFLLSDIAAMATSDMLDKKYLKREIKTDFKIYYKKAKLNMNSSEKANLFLKYEKAAMKTFSDNRYRRLQELTIAYGIITGGKIVPYLDKMNPLPFYKYKLRIKKVFAHRLHERSMSTLAGMISQSLLDSAVTGPTLGLETAQESLTDFMSHSSFDVFTNAYDVVTPPAAELIRELAAAISGAD